MPSKSPSSQTITVKPFYHPRSLGNPENMSATLFLHCAEKSECLVFVALRAATLRAGRLGGASRALSKLFSDPGNPLPRGHKFLIFKKLFEKSRFQT